MAESPKAGKKKSRAEDGGNVSMSPTLNHDALMLSACANYVDRDHGVLTLSLS